MNISTAVIELMVQEVENSIAFYCSTLGFKLSGRAPLAGKPMWAELTSGDAKLMVQDRSDMASELPIFGGKKPGGSIIVVMRTSRDDLKLFSQDLPQSVHTILPLHETDYGSLELAIADPDGYVILLAGKEPGKS